VEETPRIIGYGTVIPTRELKEPSSETLRLANLDQELARLERDGFPEIDLDKVERRGVYIVDERGTVWHGPDPGEPIGGRHRSEWGYGVTSRFRLAWYRRTHAPEPTSRRELDMLDQRRAEEEERRRSDRAMDLAEQRLHAEPVTLSETAKLPDVTLRQAVEQIDALGGTVKVRSGRVVVSLPRSQKGSTEYGPKRAIKLAQLIYAGEAEVLEVESRGGDVNAEKLPDRPLLPSGRVLPA
jgi:hypothetical protein